MNKNSLLASGIFLFSSGFFMAFSISNFLVEPRVEYSLSSVFRNYIQDTQSAIVIGDVAIVSHNEAYDFVLADDTNRGNYSEGYNCVDFALDLWRSAAWEGIESKLIGMELEFGPGHVAVGFPDVNGVLLIIDPITDAIMQPIVGEGGFSGIWELALIKIPLEAYDDTN